jgi:tetratricopeptide (TPR) repeat protein
VNWFVGILAAHHSGHHGVICRFREENRGGGLKQYNKEHCELLVEELDRIGAESFDDGDFSKALNAFNHSLRVKTEAMEHFDHWSTAGTIHRIGDVYSKQSKWALAKEAYAAALQVFKNGEPKEDDLDAQRIMSTLRQKVSILRRHIAIQKSERLVVHHVV